MMPVRRRPSPDAVRSEPRGRRKSAVSLLAVTVALVLVATTLHAQPALAKGGSGGADGPDSISVPVHTAGSRSPVTAASETARTTSVEHADLPAAGSATVAVSGVTSAVGGLPVRLTGVTPVEADPKIGKRLPAATAVAAPSAVTTRVLDAGTSTRLGITGVVLALTPASGSGQVHATFDYTGFANYRGGNFGARLRLVQLPSCALTTPDVAACQQQTPISSVNVDGAVSADLGLGGTSGSLSSNAAGPESASSTMVVALAATASSSAGDYGATSLLPSYSWAAGDQSGDFSYSYPMRVPSSLGGPQPSLKLNYSSGSVDGRTSASSGQVSMQGDGWDLDTGFIERSYRPCKDDGNATGDECWFSNNATMMFSGSSAVLIYDDATHIWHSAADNALKIDQVFGTGATDAPGTNGTYNAEYWRVTTQDGTQYYFGMVHRYVGDQPAGAAPASLAGTQSVGLVPVYGNNSGEPCYNATYANASCEQAYRWNLDYVVDPRGNSMTYFYNKYEYYYGHNNSNGAGMEDYTVYPVRIDYGTRAGTENALTAPMKVNLNNAVRCLYAGQTPDKCAGQMQNWPDTPWDLACYSSTSCPTLPSPVFWSPYDLSSVVTSVWNAATSAYRTVDKWDLSYTWPSTGDNISPAGDDTSPNLWLNTVTHTGYAADGTTTLAEAPISFGGVALANRVDWGSDVGRAPARALPRQFRLQRDGRPDVGQLRPRTMHANGVGGVRPSAEPEPVLPADRHQRNLDRMGLVPQVPGPLGDQPRPHRRVTGRGVAVRLLHRGFFHERVVAPRHHVRLDLHGLPDVQPIPWVLHSDRHARRDRRPADRNEDALLPRSQRRPH